MSDLPAGNSSRRLRIAFDQSQQLGWTGGMIYIQNLLGAIAMLDESERPYTIVIDRQDEVACKGPADKRAQLSTEPRGGFFKRVHRKISKYIKPISFETPLAKLLDQEKVDVVFTNRIYPSSIKLPLFAWIADFQFVHLPDVVGKAELAFCIDLNNKLIDQSKALLLSSQDVLKDLKSYAPAAAPLACVAQFVAQIPADIYDVDPEFICTKYSLERTFFYMPNQFWLHKNHLLVVKALQILARRSVAITVVCTGNTFDHRHTDHFHSILSEVATGNVHDQFRILGLIPRSDVFQLQRQALAIIQPSLFEGWSTSIEEAKSIGKRVVCSDLAVNQEQIPQADFFARNDAQSLADCLEKVAKQAQPGPDLAREADARAKLPERTKQFARQFLAAARQACS